MAPDRRHYHRRSIRLKGVDYTQPGAYFVTICAYQREEIFGEVVKGAMVMNEFGRIVWEEWFKTTTVRANVCLHEDEFMVMPNHMHGIIWIVEHEPTVVGATRRVAPTGIIARTGTLVPGSLGAILAQFKSISAKHINLLRGTIGVPVWQRNYYEHIIRSESELRNI